jgi:hypothetical protein
MALHNACPTYTFLGSNPESICIPDLIVTSRLCEGPQHVARIPSLAEVHTVYIAFPNIDTSPQVTRGAVKKFPEFFDIGGLVY